VSERPRRVVCIALQALSQRTGCVRAFAALGLVCLGVSVSALAPAADDIIRTITRQVVSVDVLEAGNLVHSHSGVVVARGEVVVPCDAMTEQRSIRVRAADSSQAKPATLGHRDILRNLCLLAVEDFDAPHVEIVKTEAVRVGERVYAIGNTLGAGIAVSDGVVSAVRSAARGTQIQFTAAVAPGSEGGGLFNAAGRLIGTIRYARLDGQNVNFAAPAEWLGEISTRATSQVAMATATDLAIKLGRESKWEELAEHAQKRLTVARDDIEAWRWLATSAERRGRHEEARDALKSLLALEPNDFFATLAYGWAQHRLGDHAGAIETAHTATRLRREHAAPWLLAAYAHKELKQPAEVRKALETAVAVDPRNAEAQDTLGRWALDTRDYATAAGAFGMQTAIERDSFSGWHNLAIALLEQRRYERALAAAERAMKLDPSSASAVVLKGRALVGLGAKREGIQTLEKSVKMSSRAPDIQWYWLGSAYRDVRLYAEAAHAYREALKIEPKSLAARQWLAWALEQMGHFDEALAEIDTVAAEHPQLSWVFRRRGIVYGTQGQDAKSIEQYERSLALDPRQPFVWRALVDAYRRAGRADDARRAYERLLELDSREADIAYRENYLPFEARK
jgi:tetratricopeptide (TPR) repeat protein